MIYTRRYRTPDDLDDLKMVSDGEYLIGLNFIKDDEKIKDDDPKYFKDTIKWLDIYFRKEIPDFTPKYKIEDLTPFRKRVSDIMCEIPYGKTMTYGEIAKIIAKEKGIKKMSAQAVGQAVGFNPICIIIPCHRVRGAGGKITGYGGGIKNKVALLKLEGNF